MANLGFLACTIHAALCGVSCAISFASHRGHFTLTADGFAAVRNHSGLYKDKKAHPELAGTILLTAANNAYMEMLENWEKHAAPLGLDWLVVALDRDIYNKLGPQRAILVDGKKVSGTQHFRSAGFNVMSCNKIGTVLEILQDTGYDVVFSDADNVFKKDPFDSSNSLGDMMRSGKYHYLYQRNIGNRPDPSQTHREVKEGNTGFYWVSARRDLAATAVLFRDTLSRCHANAQIEDQKLFWEALREIRTGKEHTQNQAAFSCARHCGKFSSAGSCSSKIFEYCDLDPFEFATGWDAMDDKKLVSYHANFVTGIYAKMGKLDKMGLWDPSVDLPGETS